MIVPPSGDVSVLRVIGWQDSESPVSADGTAWPELRVALNRSLAAWPQSSDPQTGPLACGGVSGNWTCGAQAGDSDLGTLTTLSSDEAVFPTVEIRDLPGELEGDTAAVDCEAFRLITLCFKLADP